MINYIKILGLSLLLLLNSSCFFNGVKGNGKVEVTQRKINNNFSSIEVKRGVKVYFTSGNKVLLTVEADSNLHNLIKTVVNDGVLQIYAEKNIWYAKAKNVYITAPNINQIVASSGADLNSENTITTNRFVINATSGSDVKLHLNVDELKCNASSGADVRLIGNANQFNVKASSGSDIKAKDFISKSCIAKASSGADIYLNVSENLSAVASSGGDIKYTGNPTIVDSDTSSSGNIKQRD